MSSSLLKAVNSEAQMLPEEAWKNDKLNLVFVLKFCLGFEYVYVRRVEYVLKFAGSFGSISYVMMNVWELAKITSWLVPVRCSHH